MTHEHSVIVCWIIQQCDVIKLFTVGFCQSSSPVHLHNRRFIPVSVKVLFLSYKTLHTQRVILTDKSCLMTKGAVAQ